MHDPSVPCFTALRNQLKAKATQGRGGFVPSPLWPASFASGEPLPSAGFPSAGLPTPSPPPLVSGLPPPPLVSLALMPERFDPRGVCERPVAPALRWG